MVLGSKTSDLDAVNAYKGCDLRPGGKLDKIPLNASASATSLWSHYVSARKPVAFAYHPQDEEWRATKRWTDEYLIQQAGDARLRVEQRGSDSESFGQGHKVDMPFRDLVRRASRGDGSCYLTTQEVKIEESGLPALHAEPMSSLIADVPLRPAMLRYLVPHQLNIWMGAAAEGASSGLHHDFHDNLYVLLRGRKQFRLYSPGLAARMYTRGSITQIHANGLITYRGQPEVRSDGAQRSHAHAWEQKVAAEAELAAAEQRVTHGEETAAEAAAQAERRLEEALDRMLDEEVDFGFGEDDEGEWDDAEDDLEGEPLRRQSGKQAKMEGATHAPDNFSCVDLSQRDDVLCRSFPAFPGKAAATLCTLSAGEMLYLPAGWFHEVTSFGGPESKGHLAVNYWFHPPDQLDVKDPTAGVYRSSYWEAQWAESHGFPRDAPNPDATVVSGQEDPNEEGHNIMLLDKPRLKRGEGQLGRKRVMVKDANEDDADGFVVIHQVRRKRKKMRRGGR